jgi:group I intron endonuclease
MLIYEAYNKNNGKSYIGLTTKTLDIRVSQHIRAAKSGSKMHFHKAIRKHGPDAFEWSVIMIVKDIDELYDKEQLCISLFEPDQLYNKSLGGEHSAYGMRHSDETKVVCGEHAKRRWDGKRAKDLWPEECFAEPSYKVAKEKWGVPKTTWYRVRRLGE